MSGPLSPPHHHSDERHVTETSALLSPDLGVAIPGTESNGGYQSTASNPTETSDDGHIAANQSLSRTRAISAAFFLGCLIFLQAVNISLLTTTQSVIANDLDAFEKTSWFTSAYLIPMSALGPLMGKLSSVFSPRHCILVSAVIMAIGSLLSAFARTFEAFIVGRAVAGVGASGVFTVSIIIVLELTGAQRRGLGIGLLNSGYTIGVAIGAFAAGALLPITGWRSLFWMQSPLALVAGSALYFTIPASFTSSSTVSSSKSTWHRLRCLDYLGALTLTTTLVLLLYALSAPKKIPILPLLLALLTAATFILNEVYLASDPVIPISLLRSRGLLLSCLGTVGFMMSRWSVLFFTPTYAIAIKQWAPSSAGGLLIPTNLGFAVGGLLIGWVHIRRQGSFYLPTLITYALFPITLLLLALLTRGDSSTVLFIAVLFLSGLVTGAALNYGMAHVLHLTPKETHYVATALLATFRGFAGSFGSAIGGGLFTRTLNDRLTTHFAERGITNDALVRKLLGSPALVASLSGKEREIAVTSYEESLKVLWLAMAGVAVLMVFVQAGTGWKGHRQDKTLTTVESDVLPSE
ncbi:related to MFS multidrug transporter [Ramularia collo-cygni]|uniref:Related to MFS multidrug transporter n=1 Tax=Ramularia collo-cygni TaxID=112498 RepID=A0A2D3V5H1_9PEZI|nr:related to MFS multidrug transporter [Ramularia collo-cygni]CZT16729.1 related to MFS multidrug transporter [Ramularia collo-cygni]